MPSPACPMPGGSSGPPSPGVITGPDDLAAALRELRDWAGLPSYATIARDVRAARLARGIPPDEATPGRVTVFDCFREDRTRLDPQLVIDIAEALGAPPEDRMLWRHVAHAAGRFGRSIVPQVTALPERPTLFVGRRAELHRLITAGPSVHLLHGLAGVGKSALATVAAHEMTRRGVVDDVIFLDLAGSSQPGGHADPFEAIDAVLRAHAGHRLMLPTSRERRAAYLSLFAAQRIALVIDDIGSWPQVEPLVPHDLKTRVIVTSRRAEAVPRGTASIPLDVLDDVDAAAMLRTATGADAKSPGLQELCELTGRLPLALTLAAARIAEHPDWPMREHADAYRDHLDTLHLDDDVHGALGVTYAGLADDDRRALRRISLHPSPQLSLETAAALAGLSAPACSRALQRLQRAHLVRPNPSGLWEAHRLVHVFAQHLAVRDERPSERKAATDRMAQHYIRAAAAAVAITQPGAVSDWYWMQPPSTTDLNTSDAARWLRREHANLMTVAAWMAEHGKSREAARLAAVLSAHLWEGGELTRALSLHRTARAAAVTHRDAAGEALAERNLGMAHVRLSRYDQARRHLTRAASLFSALGDGDGHASALNNLAIVATMTGDYQLALQHMDSVCMHYRETGDHEHLVGSLTNVGVIRSRMGEVTASVDIQEEAAQLAGRHGWQKREQLACSNIAGLLADSGDVSQAPRAARSARRAAHLARRRGDDVGLAYAESNLATALHLGGDAESGRALAVNVLGRAEALSIRELVAAMHNNIGEMIVRDGDLDAAREHFAAGLAVATDIGESFETQRARENLDRLG